MKGLGHFFFDHHVGIVDWIKGDQFHLFDIRLAFLVQIFLVAADSLLKVLPFSTYFLRLLSGRRCSFGKVRCPMCRWLETQL